MFVQALMDSTELGHFLGDIPALIIAALVLEFLLRKQLALSQDDMSWGMFHLSVSYPGIDTL